MLLIGPKPSTRSFGREGRSPSPSIAVVIASIVACFCSTAQTLAGPPEDGTEFFESRIRPLLVKNCYECHSGQAKELQGKLRLDSREALRRGGESGPAIAPGNPQGSLLVRAIRYEDHEMPPKGKLPASAIADVEHWVKIGAPDPRDRADGESLSPAMKKRKIDFAEARKHWAYQPV